jgi:hypothetical protein
MRWLLIPGMVIVLGLMGYAQYRRAVWWSERSDKKNAPQKLFPDDNG